MNIERGAGNLSTDQTRRLRSHDRSACATHGRQYKGEHTTPTIAAALGVDDREAERALREAERETLVGEDQDRSINVPPFDRQYWHITLPGLAEIHRLGDDIGQQPAGS